jgi:NADP-dependent 3-hydroxy acid dehydrogenase YdfG
VTEINPGLVNTEFSAVRFKGDQAKADKVYEGMTPLRGEDIAEILLFAATRPPHVNIADVIVMPTDQANSVTVRREGV